MMFSVLMSPLTWKENWTKIGVTPGFKGKSGCIEYMCARIKLHTCIDSVYTRT
jgi:hypothetical protein